MKSLISIFLLSMFLCASIDAQLSLQLEGGVNSGRARYLGEFKPDFAETENVIGYFIAAIPQYELTNRLKVGVEFQYSVEGYKVDIFGTDFSKDLHYIRLIPEVQFKVFGPVSLFAGVNLGLLGAEKFKNDLVASFGSTIFDNHSDFDFGLLSGLNVSVKGVYLSIKYNYGLAAIEKLSATDVDGGVVIDSKMKNRFLQVGLGYRIDFKI